ncbi:glutamate--tRNA ligase [Candidatus Pacearchaeota archaeon]|nr:glutamate--tRNA ligase [Candidatus Pacearchaeota archaeon]
MIKKEIIFAYALKNAIEHDGKAVAGSVISGLFNHGLTKGNIKGIMPNVNEVLKEVNLMSIAEQESEFSKYEKYIGSRPEREGMPDLPDVGKKGVIMRFAPAPSGRLHLGHIISSMPSSIYVNKYGGKFIVRIEDTDPERVSIDSYKSIKEDCDWIFGNVTEYMIQSDRMEIYYKYALDLIKKDSSYVCNCDPLKFKELITKKKECSCRSLDIKDNVKRWEKMLSKNGYDVGEAVLRFKSDLKDKNPALRDFPLARINLKSHPRQKKKYRVWPLMNLSVSTDDIEYKMTHIIRGKDHKDNSLRQRMIFDVLGFEKSFPHVIFIGRIKFSDFDMSKRKITTQIKEGKYSGWDDIRLPTIEVVRKRGYQPQAFCDFAIQRGLSEIDKVISKDDFFQIIDNFNRDILREKTKKYEFSQVKEKTYGNLVVVMPDNSKVMGESDIKDGKIGDIVYFSKFGYCRLNVIEGTGAKKKMVFWYCHK